MTTHEHPPLQPMRAIAPDLARGLMLLFIALANVPWFLYGPTPTALTSTHRLGATGLDAVWQTIAIIAIDGRSYPLFAFLFGYGIWQFYLRQERLGVDEKSARRLLQLRHLWMIAFGAVHAALLWQGDVVGAYGQIGLIVVWLFLRRADRTLRRWCIALGSILALLTALVWVVGIVTPLEYASLSEFVMPQLAAETSYLTSVVLRAEFWFSLAFVQGLLGLIVPMAVLLGILFARRRVLESPEAHRPLLVRIAAIGITIGWAGAVPSVLVHHGIWLLPEWTPALLHMLTGLFAGLGYAALFGLLAIRLASRPTPGPLVTGLTAIGKRSLSCYLLQSAIFAPLMAAWGLGLGRILDEWQAALVAVAAWVISMVFAVALETAGKRGPAEWLLRALTYRGKRSSATPVAA